MLEYFLLFIGGGLFFVSIEYITNYISPRFGAILAAFPIGIVSALFFIQKNKLFPYLHNYIFQVSLNLFTALFFIFLLHLSFPTYLISILLLSIWTLSSFFS